MSNHGTEEDQQTQPDEGEATNEADNLNLAFDTEVRINGGGDDQQGNGEQGVAASDEDILEAAFALKQPPL